MTHTYADEQASSLSEPLPEHGLTAEQHGRALALTLAKPLLQAKPFGATDPDDLIRVADWILTGSPKQRTYPFTEGSVQVLGPSVIATDNGSLINWLGVNYLPDEEDDEGDGVDA